MVIDGYNLIMALDRYRSLMLDEPEAARRALVEDLASYHTARGHPTTVVFDGARGLWHHDREYEERGVTVIFSQRGKSADDIIDELAGKERERMVAVTGDRELARRVESHDAVAVGPMAFGKRLDRALMAKEGERARRPPPGRKSKRRVRKRLSRLAKL